ncbi:LacI family DNA-binding transcriptional regulator [Paenibacillus sp. SI8]|uniref:LacI family DNA-binding transcriptional regulator n=1 Tax=unclassified Paenibacillus TaxID=185978 RepID=UPI0034673844
MHIYFKGLIVITTKSSMQDIADKLGISKNAVSLALNHKPGVSDELRSRIFETAEQLQYRTEPKNKKRNNLVILLPSFIQNDNPFYYEIFWAIEKRAAENGYNAIVCSITPDMADQLVLPDLYHELTFHGILIVGEFGLHYAKKLQSLGIPLVAVDNDYDSLQLDAVVTANAEGAYRLVSHLIDNGHRSIGFIGDIDSSKKFKERWYGYQNAMNAASLQIEKNHCILNKPAIDDLNAIDSTPTAWFCANDRIAIRIIQMLNSQGRQVPEAVSVVGFDDIEAASMISPRLTTIQVQREQLGIEAVDYLIRKIDQGGMHLIPSKLSIYGQLIERESSAAIPLTPTKKA